MSELSAYGAHLFYCLSRTYRARPYVVIIVDVIVYCQSLVSPVHRFPVSSANAARHLRAQRAARQTLIVNPISPTPGIRQVLARTCTTSTSPSYGLWTVSCTVTVGAPYLQHHQVQHFSQSFACPSPRPRLTHVVRQSVRGRPTSTTNLIFLVLLFCLFCP